MMWIVIGAQGMLGTELMNLLRERNIEARGLDRDEVDITDPEPVHATITEPCVVVNCAAYTAVDAAEDDAGAAFAVNAVGPQLLARRCAEVGATIVQISTDYVFGGNASEPYAEDGALAPASVYGWTKGAGEWAVQANHPSPYIVRTAWLYGEHGKCFPKTMARLAADRDELSVVTDERGQPTWTWDLADLIIRLISADAPAGIYHGTSSGDTTWFDFTREIVASIGRDPNMVKETTAAAFKRPAPRPSFSVLGHDALVRAGIEPIGPWDERWREAAARVVGSN